MTTETIRWTIERIAMILLALLVITPAVTWLTITGRCVVWFVPECVNLERTQLFREWLGETVPVLVAIIMSRRRSGE